MGDRGREARAKLAAAIERLAESQAKARAADLARERAEALAEEARAQFAQMGAADREAARRLADEIRAGVSSGGKSITNHDAVAKAEAELGQALAALELLNSESDSAGDAIRVAITVVHDAGQHVINLEAEALAAELIAHHQRASELRSLLFGLSYVPTVGTDHFAPWPMPVAALEALKWSEPQHASDFDPVKIAAAGWTRYRDALVDDPRATFGARALDRKTVKAIAVE